MVRPILNKWHPSTKKITYWFPTLFSIGLIGAIILAFSGINWLLLAYVIYFISAFALALIKTHNILVSILVIPAILIQFIGYGYGFLKSTIAVSLLNKNPESHFPNLFFKLK